VAFSFSRAFVLEGLAFCKKGGSKREAAIAAMHGEVAACTNAGEGFFGRYMCRYQSPSFQALLNESFCSLKVCFVICFGIVGSLS
jgi:hypothetical protein